jgi:AcrR family transcriptional regulator
MSLDVKPQKRQYQSVRRQEQAAQTRRDILAAAGTLFRERGYAQTSMPAIASHSSVATETLYRAFGGKAALFRAVVEAVIAGGTARADIPVEERPAIRALIEEPDPRRQIELYAATQPGIHRRSGPLLRALRDAALTDSELAGLWREMESWRLNGQGRFAGQLAERGHLREGLSVEDGRDIVFALCSLSVYDILVIERGWADDRYRDWLAATLADSLLGCP